MVCPNLASCYIAENISTTPKLKVAAHLDVFAYLDDHPPAEVPPPDFELGDCCFLRKTPINVSVGNMSFYMHPSTRYPSFDEKSLELCTGNLGSKMGCDVVAYSCGEDIPLDSPPFANLPEYASSKIRVDLEKLKQEEESSSLTKLHRRVRKISSKNANNFPPPLTTMSGSNTLQLCSRREDGRLILEAVESPFLDYYMQAERGDGRLRIWLSTGCVSSVTSAYSASAEDEEESDHERGDEVAEQEETDGCEAKDQELDGEMDKFHGLNRCKEGEHGGHEGLCAIWKPSLWVATS